MLAGISVLALAAGLRPPSVPLMVQDPFTSFWSPCDTLNGCSIERWNGKKIASAGLLTVDGACFTWLGAADLDICPPVKQLDVDVAATQTKYTFAAGAVTFSVTFRTAKVLEETLDLTAYSLPVTRVGYSAAATDGKAHDVRVYFDMTGTSTTVKDADEVVWDRTQTAGAGYTVVKIGRVDQTFAGTDDNINWGQFAIAIDGEGGSAVGVAADDARHSFAVGSPLPADAPRTPRSANDNAPVVAVVKSLSVAPSGVAASAYVVLGYDDGPVAMNYFGEEMPPYWRHVHGSFESAVDYYLGHAADIQARSDAFDTQVYNELDQVGGPKYASLGTLAYRQVMGGIHTVWNPVENTAWVFLKEISSDGDVSTIDVVYPASPIFLHFNPEMYKQLLLPVMVYANNGTSAYKEVTPYNLAWAPHHLGVWPQCHLKASQQEQMPVEESGNMLLGIVYIALKQKDLAWLEPYWGLLDTWATYLQSVLPDPGNQLCTDDFEGPSPHNANLAVKGVVSLAAYSRLLTLKGDTRGAAYWKSTAATLAREWIGNATDASGAHTKLQYNLPGTWSQKYNMVWVKAMDLGDLFPQALIDAETAFYTEKMNDYGLPLDSRAGFTKLDWSLWSGALGGGDFFNLVVDKMYKWVGETPDRVPFSDWTETESNHVHRFRARPVMGGLWMGMLTQQKI